MKKVVADPNPDLKLTVKSDPDPKEIVLTLGSITLLPSNTYSGGILV